MKKIKILIGVLIITLGYQFSFGQNGLQGFVLLGTDPETIEINQTFTTENEIFPFDDHVSTIFGLALNGDISLKNEKSLVRVILVDKKYEEHLIYEAYSLLKPDLSFSVDKICEETCILNSVKPHSVRVEITDATITINSLTYASGLKSGTDVPRVKKEKMQSQNKEKINEINKNLKVKGLNWVAGPTSVSEMTYAERKKLYGQSTFPLGFEYYVGGVIKTGATSSSRETSLMVDYWDWRDRHGQDWITPVTDQGQCGSCWAFAATGSTEAMVNLYFNQHLDMDLSEQDVLSCSDAGSCSGGSPGPALDYITSTGVVDEGTFPYTATDQPCTNKGSNPSELIKIGGRIPFPSTEYPGTEDDLKRMIIERGPISGGLDDWWHAMVLPGYQVVKEGDIFYYRDLNLNTFWKTVGAGDPLIGETVWIFKNSWGVNWGDNGYVYVETNISNIYLTHALLTPVTSEIQNYIVVCEDNDGDGYYWWGLGEKPATCDECPDEPDGDDSDANLGPLNEYGYCTGLVSPVADFSGDPTNVMVGQSVAFTDQSSNNPTSWAWSFPDGDPSTSTEQNPVVTYPTIDTYDVTLTATNGVDSDTHTKTSYINVTEYVVCTSAGNNVSQEWIQKVDLGTFANISGSNEGYGDFTDPAISVESGQTYTITLTPGYSSRARKEFWRVWIDYNMDGDFTDAGEEVLAKDRKKVTVTETINIPTDLTGETRMRISMKYNAVPSSCEHFPYGEVEDYTLLFGTPVPQPPVADFSGTPTTVSVGNSVQFTDQSENDPTSWEWTFTEGTPSTSTDQNPNVTYNTEGTYTVSLTVTNNEGSDTKTITDYINVTDDPVTTYCEPIAINNSQYFIDDIAIGSNNGVSGQGSTGYTYYTDPVFALTSDNSTATLIPNNDKRKFFWRIWLDANNDGDFVDEGETLFALDNVKGPQTGPITIPGFTDPGRLRISMRTGSAPAPCDDNFPGEVEDYDVIPGSGGPLSQIEDSETMVIELYPNPVTGGELHLKVSISDSPVSIRIYDKNGKLIDNLQTVNEHSIINIAEYNSGVYFVKVSDGDDVVVKKFVKMQ